MTCAECGVVFPLNNELATIPEGQRIAFDAVRGRVWRICSSCRHWHLIGPEGAAPAIPELLARFQAGRISEQQGSRTARISGTLELTQLLPGSPDSLPVDPDIVVPRNDVAALARRKELIRKIRGKVILAGLTALIFSRNSLSDIRALFAASPDTAWFWVLGIVGIWYVSLHWIRSRRRPVSWVPPMPIVAAPGSSALEHLSAAIDAVYGLILCSTCLWVPTLWGTRSQGALVPILEITTMIFLFLATCGLMLVRDGQPVGCWVSLFVVGGGLYAHLTLQASRSQNLALLLCSTTAVVTLLVVIGLVHRWRARREGHPMPTRLIYRGNRGEQMEASIDDGDRIRLAWSETGRSLVVYGLPGADLVTGYDAIDVVRKVLRLQQEEALPTGDEVQRATDILRQGQDLHGVLAALNGMMARSDGQVSLKSIPKVYQLALDMALAAPRATTTDVMLRREFEAEAAALVAEEAERLDRGE